MDPYLDDELPSRSLDLAFLRRLWPFVRPYRSAFGLCLVFLALSFVLEMLGPYLLRLAIDGPMTASDLTADERLRQLWWIGAGFLAVTVAGVWLGYSYGLLTAWNGQRVIRDVRAALFGHILRLPPRFFERNPAGKLTTRVTSDVENLNELITTGVLQSIFDLLKIVGVLTVLFVVDWRLALFTMLATPVVAVISLSFRRKASAAYREVRGRLALQNAFTTEAVGGVRATRAFGREDSVQQRYAEMNHSTADSWRKTVFHFALFFALVDLAIRATTVGMLYVGGRSVLGGTMQVGEFVQFWMYFGLLSAPIKELGEKYNVLQAAFASTERIFRILGEKEFPPDAPAAAGDVPRGRRGAAEVDFDDVQFSYVPDKPVLMDVSFRAGRGRTVAVVGPTGAGKTTLLTLLSRLYDPDHGRILLDGRDLREWDLRELRSRVAVVSQDLFLFTGTVLDNVRLFDRRITEAEVLRSLEVAGAADFVRGLPDGLHTQVEERGVTFSQGERQLLSFARALVTDPDLLVLDEATASIDSATEERLQRALAAALRGRTAIVVAHRLSTVRDADVILVMEHGRIVERGTHDELIRRDGSYARMLSAV